MKWYTIRDRQFGTTTRVEKDVSEEAWPFAIDAPSPPFAFGGVVALVIDRDLAEKIVCLLNEEKD